MPVRTNHFFVSAIVLLGFGILFGNEPPMTMSELTTEKLVELKNNHPDYIRELDHEGLILAYQFESLYVGGYDATLKIAQRIVEIADEDPEKMAQGYARMALSELHYGKWNPEWENWLKKAGELAGDGITEARGDFLRIRGYLRAKYQQQMDEGLDDLMIAISIGNQLENNELLTVAYANASNILLFLEMKSRSWEYARRSVYFAELTNRVEYRYFALKQLYYRLVPIRQKEQAKQVDSELAKLQEVLEMVRGSTGHATERHSTVEKIENLKAHIEVLIRRGEPDDQANLSDARWQLATLQGELARFRLSLENARLAREMYLVRRDIDGVVHCDVLIAMNLFGLQKYEDGQSAADRTIEALQEIQYFDKAVELCTSIASILANSEDPNRYELVYAWTKRADQLRSELPRERAVEMDRVTDLFVRQDRLSRERAAAMRRKAEELASSQRVQEEKETEARRMLVERQTFLRRAVLSLGVTSSILIVGFWIWLNRRIRKQLESKVREQTVWLEESKRLAEQADQAKSRFLAHLNHELRNPLQSVLANAELLERHESDSAVWAESLAGVKNNSRFLCQIVGDILDLSRIESGETPIEEAAFELQQAIKSVFQVLQPLAEANDSLVTSQVNDPIGGSLFGDAGKLRQILINLGSNAIKFSERGKVAFQVKTTPIQHRIWLTIDVTDTGPGIPENDRAAVFEPFFRSSLTDPSTQGTGLGLPLARSLAELLGGHLSLVRSDAAGSCFRVELPFDRMEASEKKAETSRQLDHRRILVVDDDPEVRRVVRLLGQSLGHDVCAASRMEQILELLSSQHFDSVLLDLQMPDHDGFVVAAQIRSMNLAPQPRIVAITGNALQSVRERALDEGFDEFLTKPFGIDSLVEII